MSAKTSSFRMAILSLVALLGLGSACQAQNWVSATVAQQGQLMVNNTVQMSLLMQHYQRQAMYLEIARLQHLQMQQQMHRLQQLQRLPQQKNSLMPGSYRR